jgi:hypothetical protein
MEKVRGNIEKDQVEKQGQEDVNGRERRMPAKVEKGAGERERGSEGIFAE